MATLYTIGHSTRTLEELVEALHAHTIQTLVDIRSFPMSRRSPYFNRENLEKALPTADIQYVWMKTLGGRRKKIRDDSPNVGLRSLSFRNYADYTLTGEFQNARYHGLWTFRVTGAEVVGTLTNPPGGQLVRRISVKKQVR